MLERPDHGLFGGLWVFPGGALDPADHGELARMTVTVPAGADDLPWRAAALRETVEEVGITLSDPPLSEAIEATGEGVYRAIRERGARLDGRRLRLLSRWVTPAGPPARFDARFYLRVVDEVPPPVARSEEVVDVTWVTPTEALAQHERGEWAMVTPTLHHLRWLADLADGEEIWSATGRANGAARVPFVESDGSEVRLPLPAVPDHP